MSPNGDQVVLEGDQLIVTIPTSNDCGEPATVPEEQVYVPVAVIQALLYYAKASTPAPAPKAPERRAPVQSNYKIPRGQPGSRPGTVTWAEHERAWEGYAQRFGRHIQSAERIAERAGFCYRELTEFLGREPKTWRPL